MMNKLKEILSYKNVEVTKSYIGNTEQDMGDMDKKVKQINVFVKISCPCSMLEPKLEQIEEVIEQHPNLNVLQIEAHVK